FALRVCNRSITYQFTSYRGQHRFCCFPFRFSSPCSSHLRDLHSFPTRRSSDLGGGFAHRFLRRAAGHLSEREGAGRAALAHPKIDRKSTRLNSSHVKISYAVFCLKKKKKPHLITDSLSFILQPLRFDLRRLRQV